MEDQKGPFGEADLEKLGYRTSDFDVPAGQVQPDEIVDSVDRKVEEERLDKMAEAELRKAQQEEALSEAQGINLKTNDPEPKEVDVFGYFLKYYDSPATIRDLLTRIQQRFGGSRAKLDLLADAIEEIKIPEIQARIDEEQRMVDQSFPDADYIPKKAIPAKKTEAEDHIVLLYDRISKLRELASEIRHIPEKPV